jgi:sulfoxide reductase heme-binding subunit YedZ
MKINSRTIVQIICYYILPAIMLITELMAIIANASLYRLLVNYGNYAMYLVIIILFVKPLSILFPKIKPFRTLMTYRREMGVLAFWFAVFHSIALLFYLEIFKTGDISILYQDSALLFGVLALFCMLILGFTSNKLAVIKLKRNWKRVQMVAYPALFLIVFHMMQHEKEYSGLIILIAFLSLKTAEYLHLKKLKNSSKN